MYTSWQWKSYTHTKQVWGNRQFQQANDNTDIKFFQWQTTMIMMKDICHSIVDDTDTRRVFHAEWTTMKRATCRFIDDNEDAEKFNSKYK